MIGGRVQAVLGAACGTSALPADPSPNLQNISRARVRFWSVCPLQGPLSARLHAVLGGTSRLFGSQILVFHFPGMIERVKGGVPYQISQRPLAGQFTL
jgi:hypothetical protein